MDTTESKTQVKQIRARQAINKTGNTRTGSGEPKHPERNTKLKQERRNIPTKQKSF